MTLTDKEKSTAALQAAEYLILTLGYSPSDASAVLSSAPRGISRANLADKFGKRYKAALAAHAARQQQQQQTHALASHSAPVVPSEGHSVAPVASVAHQHAQSTLPSPSPPLHPTAALHNNNSNNLTQHDAQSNRIASAGAIATTTTSKKKRKRESTSSS